MNATRKTSGLPKTSMLVAGITLSVAMAGAASAQTSLGAATSPDGKVRMDILSLKRTEGETVTIRFQITNSSNDTYRVTVDNMRLIDVVGRRIYSPGITSPGCLTPVGQRETCYAIFGAPPASTQKINVQFYEKTDLITGVPIGE